jgi:hypothetical protein
LDFVDSGCVVQLVLELLHGCSYVLVVELIHSSDASVTMLGAQVFDGARPTRVADEGAAFAVSHEGFLLDGVEVLV